MRENELVEEFMAPQVTTSKTLDIQINDSGNCWLDQLLVRYDSIKNR